MAFDSRFKHPSNFLLIGPSQVCMHYFDRKIKKHWGRPYMRSDGRGVNKGQKPSDVIYGRPLFFSIVWKKHIFKKTIGVQKSSI